MYRVASSVWFVKTVGDTSMAAISLFTNNDHWYEFEFFLNFSVFQKNTSLFGEKQNVKKKAKLLWSLSILLCLWYECCSSETKCRRFSMAGSVDLAVSISFLLVALYSKTARIFSCLLYLCFNGVLLNVVCGNVSCLVTTIASKYIAKIFSRNECIENLKWKHHDVAFFVEPWNGLICPFYLNHKMCNSASNYDKQADQKEDDDESLVIDSHKEVESPLHAHLVWILIIKLKEQKKI